MNSVFQVPSLARVCVSKVVNEIELFCQGEDFEELGKESLIVGPLEKLPSSCIETIFKYVICTRQLNQAWLSVLIVSHLKTIDFTFCTDFVDIDLVNTLILRCQHLEKFLIPNCKRIPNDSLCKLLTLNPCLLTLDISNKLTPSIDQPVIRTLVNFCRFLTILKLSDYRLEDPKTLLLLCGRRAVSRSRKSSMQHDSPNKATDKEKSLLNSDSSNSEMLEGDKLLERVTNKLLPDADGASACDCNPCDVSDTIAECVAAEASEKDASVSSDNGVEERAGHHSTREEEENQRGRDLSPDGSDAESHKAKHTGEDDIYEDDSSVCPIEVEDHSSDFGCLELETLWLENVNLTDQVAAVLLQTLHHLRDINLSDTDICNPWRLIDTSQASHLRYLEDLDVKSTALSRTALQMIPKFHPDLRKLSISSTTLPPPTYGTVAKLSGIAELELIGGQFYPCEPEEIFTDGIVPAVNGVGEHLQYLNLTYFAHVKFSEIILSCPRIRHLDLSHTDIFVTYPCPSVGEHCPNLASLNLGYAHIEARDSSMSPVPENKVIEKMIGQPPVLEELHLDGLIVSDEGMKTMYQGKEYPLTVLNVSRCKMLTISGIKHLWNKCPFLMHIDITHCREVSFADYRKFEEECKEARPIFKLEGTLKWK